MTTERLKLLSTVLGFAASLVSAGSSSAENLLLPENLKWVILASREALEEAMSFASIYENASDGVRVVLAKNGRYAVVLGPVKELNINKVHARKDLPSDAYLAGGKTLAETVWMPTKKAATTAKKKITAKRRKQATVETTISKPTPNVSTPDQNSESTISPR